MVVGRTLRIASSALSLVLLALAGQLRAQSLYEQAQAVRARGQLDSAWDLVQRAAAAEPSRAEVQFLLGDIACDKAGRASVFSAMGLARKCKAAFGRAVELAPDSLAYIEALASYLMQAPGIAGGDKDSAQKLADKVRSRDEVRGVFLLTRIWWQGNAASKARADSAVEALGRSHPADRVVQSRVAGWWDGTSRPERALPIYQAMLGRDPADAVAHFFVGRELVVMKRTPREAQEHLRLAAAATAPAAGPNVFTFTPGAPWYRLGQTYVQLGMGDSARLCLERALRINGQLTAARRSLDSLTHP